MKRYKNRGYVACSFHLPFLQRLFVVCKSSYFSFLKGADVRKLFIFIYISSKNTTLRLSGLYWENVGGEGE
ncbi:MAG TPA: hypothetical protein VLZ33_07820 [Dysgonamonadaceae bacterium]|nr:hypothetical protein [Dysgonamonadaceae bacterium]